MKLKLTRITQKGRGTFSAHYSLMGKKQVTHEIPKLIYKGTQIEETNEIPEIFNSHFSTIGILLANQINSNSQNYLRYLSNRN